MLKSYLPAAIAILLWSLYCSMELFYSWHHSPFERYGWVALAIWLVPLAADFQIPRVSFLLTSLAFNAIGMLGSLNTAYYVALSFALASFVQVNWIWLAGAVTWMTAFGWAFKFLGPGAVSLLRIALASCATLWYLWNRKRA